MRARTCNLKKNQCTRTQENAENASNSKFEKYKLQDTITVRKCRSIAKYRWKAASLTKNTNLYLHYNSNRSFEFAVSLRFGSELLLGSSERLPRSEANSTNVRC